MICTNCGKEFKFKEIITRHSYGFVKGKPYGVFLCDNCSKDLSDEEYNNLERKISEKK